MLYSPALSLCKKRDDPRILLGSNFCCPQPTPVLDFIIRLGYFFMFDKVSNLT